MEYSIREVSEMAGVSARTLRYYDEIGLLKPAYVSEAGYRYYGEKELLMLQQILFYRERQFDLKRIGKILYQKDFDIMKALQEHLLELQDQKNHLESLICTVEQTILSMKGEYEMSDREKFEVFKEKLLKENEERFGQEAREKYGDEQVDASYKKIRGMTEEDYERFQDLGEEIRLRLEEAVTAGEKPESDAGRRIVTLHKNWISSTWKEYHKEAHKGLANMYLYDERFKKYYDRKVEGCAQFLTEAVACWVDQLF